MASGNQSPLMKNKSIFRKSPSKVYYIQFHNKTGWFNARVTPVLYIYINFCHFLHTKCIFKFLFTCVHSYLQQKCLDCINLNCKFSSKLNTILSLLAENHGNKNVCNTGGARTHFTAYKNADQTNVYFMQKSDL